MAHTEKLMHNQVQGRCARMRRRRIVSGERPFICLVTVPNVITITGRPLFAFMEERAALYLCVPFISWSSDFSALLVPRWSLRITAFSQLPSHGSRSKWLTLIKCAFVLQTREGEGAARRMRFFSVLPQTLYIRSERAGEGFLWAHLRHKPGVVECSFFRETRGSRSASCIYVVNITRHALTGLAAASGVCAILYVSLLLAVSQVLKYEGI